VVVLAGPSGSGKSRLAQRLALPVLALDDFYRDGDETDLPRVELAAGRAIVDWDDVASWDKAGAVATLERLCRDGSADIPVYDISASRVTGRRVVGVAGHDVVVAEGIFAAEVVADLRALDLLATAVCVRHHRLVTFALRLVRDLREHRKAPLVLLSRGWRLMRTEPQLVRHMAARGCAPMSPRRAETHVRALVRA